MVDIKNIEVMTTDEMPYPVSRLETVKVYDNNIQINVAANLIIYLNTITTRPEDTVEAKDAMRAALVASTKFAVQTYYEANKRQFTEEHKKEILNDVSKILDTQLNQMIYAQTLAH